MTPKSLNICEINKKKGRIATKLSYNIDKQGYLHKNDETRGIWCLTGTLFGHMMIVNLFI